MVSGSRIYIHVQLDGGIFLLREDFQASLVSKSGLIAELDKLATVQGHILYSRENPTGEPPPHVAEVFQCIEAARLPIRFIEPIKEVVNRPEDYVPPLIHAAYRGEIPWLEELIGWGVDLEARDQFGQTALMMAAHSGQHHAITLLLKAGADVNASDPDGSTPLMFAAQHGYTDVATTLVRGGANVGTKGRHGFDARALAEQNHHKDLAVLLGGRKGFRYLFR